MVAFAQTAETLAASGFLVSGVAALSPYVSALVVKAENSAGNNNNVLKAFVAIFLIVVAAILAEVQNAGAFDLAAMGTAATTALGPAIGSYSLTFKHFARKFEFWPGIGLSLNPVGARKKLQAADQTAAPAWVNHGPLPLQAPAPVQPRRTSPAAQATADAGAREWPTGQVPAMDVPHSSPVVPEPEFLEHPGADDFLDLMGAGPEEVMS